MDIMILATPGSKHIPFRLQSLGANGLKPGSLRFCKTILNIDLMWSFASPSSENSDFVRMRLFFISSELVEGVLELAISLPIIILLENRYY